MAPSRGRIQDGLYSTCIPKPRGLNNSWESALIHDPTLHHPYHKIWSVYSYASTIFSVVHQLTLAMPYLHPVRITATPLIRSSSSFTRDTLALEHADITQHEWLTHQHRDTCASIVGHPALLTYLAIAEGERIGRMKFELCERMLQPCGLPPPKDDD
ncbi:hypothetical protein PSTT_13888 [Puccinia striiformis]|uniref:Splicing factor 3B subunit 5/RDS3 complex subunit 10 n=1 Tax=Puccinia striiformis TaxID=27350 RepID=A0A2S4UQ64_9BASI|nr:hypothetical protein PSTT_13888 [Puccinia striiformis]